MQGIREVSAAMDLVHPIREALVPVLTDFMMARNFPMPRSEDWLQFRFEAFNFTNTPQ